MGGKIAEVSSFHPGRGPENMFDGDPATYWHTQFKPDFAPKPHFVILEVPDGNSIAGLSYTAHSRPNGRVLGYKVSVSDDVNKWGAITVKGRMKADNPAEQRILFPAPVNKKFIKFEITDAVSGGGQRIAAIGELDVLTK